MAHSPRIAPIVLCLLALPGCADELGPERPEVAPVEGRLTIEGRPVTSGFLVFTPADGTRGNARSAQIGPDGHFKTIRVAVGTVVVGTTNVLGPPIPTAFGPVPLSTFQNADSPIRKRISAGQVNRLDIDLAREARDFQQIRHMPAPTAKE